jgi:hypothetical protein
MSTRQCLQERRAAGWLQPLTRAAFIAAVLVLARFDRLIAAETVKITLPAAVTFAVTNVSVSTTGSPNPTTISFSNASLLVTHSLRISVEATGNFVPPSGAAIPASNVTWTTSGAVHGTGSNGTLSTTAYGQLFQSVVHPNSGSVSVTWTLLAPGTSIVAGAHVLTMRWKLEAV